MLQDPQTEVCRERRRRPTATRRGATEPSACRELQNSIVTCRAAFGGDATCVGRFPIDGSFDLDSMVPDCAPEPLVGLVADFATFALIPTAFAGRDRAAVGERARFGPFAMDWRHPPALLHARVTCPGGTVSRDPDDAGSPVLRWRPDRIDLTMVRQVAGDSRILLSGVEEIELMVALDPGTGRIERGSTCTDVIRAGLALGYDGDALPSAGGELPPTPIPVTVTCVLTLERID